jgi:prepilin-type N-terminal cleavage/methylation domain-containing protein/prepilin-type processing-associated H-X9-DG protein
LRKTKAFTLVELVVVIAIIALLMGILLPALNRARATAQRVVCMAMLRSFGQANMAYATSSNGKFVPFSRAPEGDNHTGWDERWPENRTFRKILSVNKKVEDTGWNDPYLFPRELLCPSQKAPRSDVDILPVSPYYDFKVRMSYAMNTELWAGKQSGDDFAWFPGDGKYRGHFDARIKKPSECIMFIESNFYQTRYEMADYERFWNKYGDVLNEQTLRQVCYRHGEKACIVYFDGHTGFLKKEEVYDKTNRARANNLQARKPILLWDVEYPVLTATP